LSVIYAERSGGTSRRTQHLRLGESNRRFFRKPSEGVLPGNMSVVSVDVQVHGSIGKHLLPPVPPLGSEPGNLAELGESLTFL
jgi:hypothetical protein